MHMRRTNAGVRTSVAFLSWLFALILLCGCRQSTSSRPESKLQESPFNDMAKLTEGLRQYLDTVGTLPASKEVFRDFCLQSNLSCCTVDWNRVSWQSQDERRLVIRYDGDGYSIPITLER